MIVGGNMKKLMAMMLAICAANLFAATVEYKWTGTGGDAKWSNSANWSPEGVPTKYDNVTFDGTAANADATIDEDFAGQVNSITLDASYTGTITMARKFRVNSNYVQCGGTFDCHTNEFGVIGGDLESGNGTRAGSFNHAEGVFKAPTGGALFRFLTRYIGGYPEFRIGNTGFDCGEDSYIKIEKSATSSGIYFYATNQIFRTIEFGFTTQVSGTGNVVKTKLIHSKGSLFDKKSSMGVRPGGASMIIEGTVEAKDTAEGGNLELVFNSAGDQTITFGAPTTNNANRAYWYPRLPGLHIDKPSGKVTVVGQQAHFGRGAGAASGCTWGISVERGMLDMSGVDLFSIGCEASKIDLADGAQILWATNALFLVRNCTVTGSHVFNNIEVDMQSSGNYSLFVSPWNATNTVLGNVTFTGSGIKGANKPNWNEFSGRQSTVLKVYGDLFSSNKKNANGSQLSGGMINLVLCNPEKDQVLHVRDGGRFPNIIVEKPEGKKVTCETDGSPVFFCAGGNNQSGGYLELRSGEFVAPEEGLCFTNALHGGILQTGGKFNNNARGPIVFANREATEGSYASLGLVDPIDDVTIDVPPLRADNGLRTFGVQVPVGYTNVIRGKLTLKQGRLKAENTSKCACDVRGDFELASHGFVGEQCPIIFGGNAVQHYINAGAYTNINSVFTIAKTGGSLVLDDDFDLRYRRAWTTAKTEKGPTDSLDFNFVSGALDFNGHKLYLPAGTAKVCDGFKFILPQQNVEGGSLVTPGTLSLPTDGNVEFGLSGRLLSTSPHPLVFATYGTLANYATVSTSAEDERMKHAKLINNTEQNTLAFDFRYICGTTIIIR